MAACTTGIFSNIGLVFQQRINSRYSQLLCPFLQVREYAARKGTRERREKLKKKRKVEVKKVGWISPHLRVKKTEILKLDIVKGHDTYRPAHTDDVWIGMYHKRRIYSFEEAIQCHRETHHPTCLDLPNAFVNAFIELDLTGNKPTKPVESFARTVDMPWPFDHGEKRTIIAFAKDPEMLKFAEKAGAALAGNAELISKIQSGEIPMDDYQFCVAHPEIMVELSSIRGILKRKYPSPRQGTLGLNLPAMIRKVLHGIKYNVKLHERQPLFGLITTPIGRLSMDSQHLEANFKAVLEDVNKMRPKREGPFIWRAMITCPPTEESLAIDFDSYLEVPQKSEESDSEDEEEEAARA